MGVLKIITLEELKEQTRVDFDDEDNSLELFGAASEDLVIGMTKRSLKELNMIGWQERNEGEVIEDEEEKAEITANNKNFPNRLRLAIRMIAAHFFRNHENVSSVNQASVPYTLGVLVKPYIKLSNNK